MKRTWISGVLSILLTSGLAMAQTSAPATTRAALPPQEADVAAPKLDGKTGEPQRQFVQKHERFLERARKGDVDLLFLGDSITEGWGRQQELFDQHFGAYKPANFGIGGDRTQHVLWRIENGELEGIKPKLVVLMIGTNNSGSDPADKIASGVEKIVHRVRDKTGAKVLLLGIFPRGQTPERAAKQRDVIAKVNERIAKLDDGGKTVRYLDLSPKFLQPDGSISKEIMPDYLHLSKQGYQIWAEGIAPVVKEMIGQ